jgi:hypothetical protein
MDTAMSTGDFLMGYSTIKLWVRIEIATKSILFHYSAPFLMVFKPFLMVFKYFYDEHTNVVLTFS